jgi:hypothetical protein
MGLVDQSKGDWQERKKLVMAKEVNALDVAAFFEAQGLEVPVEVQERIANAVSDAAWHRLNEGPLNGKKENVVTKWQERLFSLATDVEKEFSGQVKNQQGRGSGQIVEKGITLDTPQGVLVVRLKSDYVAE